MSATIAPARIPPAGAAVGAAVGVVAAELLVLAWLRHKFFQTGFAGHSWRSPSAEPSSPRSAPPWAPPPPEADHPITTNDKGE